MAVTRTPNVFNLAVLVDVSHHDSLLYRVTVRGLPIYLPRPSQFNGSQFYSDELETFCRP